MVRRILHTKTTRQPNDSAWFTEDCRKVITQKEKAFKLWRQDPTNVTKHADFINHRSLAQQTIRRAKAAHFKVMRDKLVENRKDRDWWWTVRQLSGTGGHTEIPSLQQNGISFSTAQEKAEVLAQAFSMKCNLNCADDPSPDIQNRTAKHLSHVNFRPRDIKRKLHKLDTNKASGPDGISAKVLKNCAVELAAPLAKLFRFSFSRGYFPSQWKVASVVPVHKKNSRSCPSNYRPISLLTIISKVMETIINDQLRKHLFHNNLISDNQFAFRSLHSAPDLLTFMSHRLSSTLNERGEARVVALDIKEPLTEYGIMGCFKNLLHLESLANCLLG